jgi:carboxymethylenebutenolidase
MPLYDPTRLEYPISNSHIQIVMDNGQQLPAYQSYPARGNKFPGVVLIHDWWGVTDAIRRLAHGFAQTGFYVIVPDLFGGRVAHTPQDAMAMVQALGHDGFYRINTALTVLEKHHQCNADVAAVGIGMGGSLAYEAAIQRKDLEAAVAFGGFPQRYFGHFQSVNAPILARLRAELGQSRLPHVVEVVNGAGHEFFSDDPAHAEFGKKAWMDTIDFLEKHLKGPVHGSPAVKRSGQRKG